MSTGRVDLAEFQAFQGTVSANRTPNTAAINPRHGMLTDLIGVTLALAVTRATEI